MARMYLSGTEDGDVHIICTDEKCMRRGEPTPWNISGLWLQDVGNLPYNPGIVDVMDAWAKHLRDYHPQEVEHEGR